LGGTVSAEHGLGKRKHHLLELQYSPHHLEAMRAVKRRLDCPFLVSARLSAALRPGRCRS
jgi:D-lactate dehydrogenase (cytochrome)/glycolate oxidase